MQAAQPKRPYLRTQAFRRHYLLALLILLVAVILRSAIGAHYPADWRLENILTAVLLGYLLATRKTLPLSLISYTLIFLYLCLHELGAHYTYTNVPYDDWWQTLTGTTLNEQLHLTRNHYDRLVHFSYGLLLTYPIREIYLRVADVRGFWGYFLPLDLVMSTSMIYELIEWTAAVALGGELGQAYLGTQGDPWDAQKDMALATLGAALTTLIIAAVNIRTKRDFAREFLDSLRTKHPAPRGEATLLRRLIARRK